MGMSKLPQYLRRRPCATVLCSLRQSLRLKVCNAPKGKIIYFRVGRLNRMKRNLIEFIPLALRQPKVPSILWSNLQHPCNRAIHFQVFAYGSRESVCKTGLHIILVDTCGGVINFQSLCKPLRAVLHDDNTQRMYQHSVFIIALQMKDRYRWRLLGHSHSPRMWSCALRHKRSI